ncbi:RNA polymerase sigma-70 factor [Olivibacter sitiensis]|uniref:RNA polymerase sigma-70 factor n=1 Tax=Olivibacter sitiensis TaxID=376470 RepID=UPI0003FE85CB|nr:RNA polymerase sigma-70 factor [Olivibacter sitiensis]
MPPFKYTNDYELILLLKKGDEDAFSYIYNQYWPSLYIYAQKIIKDGLEAEDIVQEVLLSIWSKGASLQINGSLSSYLFGAIRFASFNQIDKKQVRQDYIDSILDFANSGINFTDDYILEKELNRIVESTIENMPPRMREVFELSRKHKLSLKEIAETMNISDKTAKKQINKALKLIKTKLDHSFLLPLSTIPVILTSHFHFFSLFFSFFI